MTGTWKATALLLALPGSAWGSALEGAGSSPCGLGAWFADPLKLGQPTRLMFAADGSYNVRVRGTTRIHLPPGLRLISGDTLVDSRPGKEWALKVVPERRGEYVVTGSLRFTRADNVVDEADMRFAFSLDGEKATVEGSEPTRLETVRNGQRYRYGRQFLVPISHSESITQGDIERGGTKAKAVTSTPAVCPTCGASSKVPYVVLLDERGAVTDIRLRWENQRVPAAVDAAVRATLRTWKFEPSRAKGKPVADWLVVEVPIEAR